MSLKQKEDEIRILNSKLEEQKKALEKQSKKKEKGGRNQNKIARRVNLKLEPIINLLV